MTPQSPFMVLAAIDPAREDDLQRLLASLNDGPGRVNPDNPLIPFRRFETLHVARILIVDDKTTGDVGVYGLAPRAYPRYLAFLGEVDGSPAAFFQDAARLAPDGLRALFSCCAGFDAGANLAGWMAAHNVGAAAHYVNWRGRTVRRVREEAALYARLEQHADEQRAALSGQPPQAVHASLRRLILADVAAGRMTLTPDAPTPRGWRIRNLLHLVGVPLIALLALPLLAIVGIPIYIRLRRLEKTDPELCPRTDPEDSAALARIEDYDVTNQFSAMGSLKPGRVRLWITTLVLLVIDYAARHIYTHGNLGRVRSIHFARWVFLDRRARIIFFSNYDGSLETYMDDFINKVGFGLNVVFSNGIGYPRTTRLLQDGCSDERKFKEYLRRHQIPTQVWYKAYPGLTAVDLERHSRVRKGIDAPALGDADARTWLALL